MKFEPNKIYRGVGPVGNSVIEVVSRTAKFLTIKTNFGINRVKITTEINGLETARFKCWGFDAADEYSKEQRSDDAYSAAYYS